ncbi:MAG: hypothetical protein JNK15_23745 [Planctomycetes bacterium]|nr:hypothetical protein [Planctomycetota bacterium]
MTNQLATDVRNAMLDAWETQIGPSPILKIRTGAPPANASAADTGTALSSATLPADFMAASSGGSKAKLGTWQDLAADAAGTAGHYRLYASDGVTCKMQGTVSLAGGGGDMILSALVLDVGVKFTVTTWTLTQGGA